LPKGLTEIVWCYPSWVDHWILQSRELPVADEPANQHQAQRLVDGCDSRFG
jgi:hypothetical protein